MTQQMYTNVGCPVDVEPQSGDSMLVTTPVGAKVEIIELALEVGDTAREGQQVAMHLVGIVADDPETEIRLYWHKEDCPDIGLG